MVKPCMTNRRKQPPSAPFLTKRLTRRETYLIRCIPLVCFAGHHSRNRRSRPTNKSHTLFLKRLIA